MATSTTRSTPWFVRYSWTVFVFLSSLLLLFGIADLPSATASTARENAINELFIGCLSAAIAVMGVRRRHRWAWYAMTLWPVWIAAQSFRAASTANAGEMYTGLILLLVVGVALALSYRGLLSAPKAEVQ